MKGYSAARTPPPRSIRDGWFALRRPGDGRRGRLLLHRRPQEGHDHPRRLQRVPARDRGGALRAPRRLARPRSSASPTTRWGEEVGAAVVLKTGAEESTPTTLRAYVKEQVAATSTRGGSGSRRSCPRARRARSSSARSRRPSRSSSNAPVACASRSRSRYAESLTVRARTFSIAIGLAVVLQVAPSAWAQEPTSTPSPKELWEAYPLEPGEAPPTATPSARVQRGAVGHADLDRDAAAAASVRWRRRAARRAVGLAALLALGPGVGVGVHRRRGRAGKRPSLGGDGAARRRRASRAAHLPGAGSSGSAPAAGAGCARAGICEAAASRTKQKEPH